jgi:tetratricopeptide (TPR) repeat protein
MGTGRYAEKPYFMDKFYVNLYSVEELCYLFVEKAEMIDRDVIQPKMVQWLDEQCGLEQLSHTLYTILNQKASTMAYVGTILEYVNLYPPDVIARTEEIIKSNEGLNPYERKKAKADYLLQNRKYYAAMEQYYSLLSQLPETDLILRAKLLHNLGVACAGMFMFRQAADWFMQAYETEQDSESLFSYLAALRMYMEEKDYITFISEHPEYHDMSLKVERQLEQAYGQFEGTDENRMLFTLQVFREEGNGVMGTAAPYYQEIGRLTTDLKAKYREYV